MTKHRLKIVPSICNILTFCKAFDNAQYFENLGYQREIFKLKTN